MSIPAEQQPLDAPYFSASSSPNTFMAWSSTFASTPQTACSKGNFNPAFTPQTACSEVTEPYSLGQILEENLGNHDVNVEGEIPYVESSEGESGGGSEDES